MTLPSLPSLEAVQDAYTRIDALWADAEAENRPANVEEANQALAILAAAIGLEEPTTAQDGDPLISLALAVATTLRDVLLHALEPGDPATEYERLLRAAEQEAPRNPAASKALLRTADRWVSSEFAAARKRADGKRPAGVRHFGSPTGDDA